MNQHGKDSVLDHLRQDFPRLLINQTVSEALTYLKTHRFVGPIIYFYVLNDSGQLQGTVSSRRLILEPYSSKMSDLMTQSLTKVPSTASVQDVYRLLLSRKLLALPVVDEENRMLGVIEATKSSDGIGDTTNHDELFQLIGVRLTEARSISPISSFISRFPWLGCNLLAGIIAALLSGMFEEDLKKTVALAFFIPVVLNLAESVSSQSVSLALEILRGQIPTWSLMRARLTSELGTGVLLGLGSGLTMGCVAVVWLGQPKLFICLLGGITAGVTSSALFGFLMPYLLRLMRLEPQVAAGPIALAGADIVTILVYLNLAHFLFAV